MTTTYTHQKLPSKGTLCPYCEHFLKEQGKEKANFVPTRPRASICNLQEAYYTSRELSEMLNVSLNAVARRRRLGTGPKYIKFGYRTYRYTREEIIKFVQQQMQSYITENLQV